MTTTIYIPQADYTQRADDDGRDFHALRTIRTAAIQWGQADGRGFTEHGDEPVVLIFAENGATTPNVWTVTEDPEMELYPAADLPFTIQPAPFKVGDWITTKVTPNRRPDRVTSVNSSNGRVGIGDWGLMDPSDYGDWMVVDAPTVTYTITVSAEHDVNLIQGALATALKDTTVQVNPA